jgi:hypothetical protein
VKPENPEELRSAFRNVGKISCHSAADDRWPQLKAAIHRVRCAFGTEQRAEDVR